MSLVLTSCILSKFYIKPQRRVSVSGADDSCILSKFYIKPQPSLVEALIAYRCILSKFYIKPQQGQFTLAPEKVVSYRNSTSNHNSFKHAFFQEFVVSYRNSTSNHNGGSRYSDWLELYLIEILHQTTTRAPMVDGSLRCILSKFYIKPQQIVRAGVVKISCILSKFYIKPQLYVRCFNYTTGCILSKFYIKPQRRASY